MAVWRGRTAESRSTGMLTRPNVIVPDHMERTGAPAVSAVSSGPPWCLRLGNLLLLHGRDAGPQAVRKIRRGRLPFLLDGLDLLAARLGFDQLMQPLAILVGPGRRIEVALDRRHQLLRE